MEQPKALLRWGPRSLLEYGISQIAEAIGPPIVVLGHEADRLAPLARALGAQIVVNERFREGRSTSIEAAVRALGPDVESILLANVDQPRPAALLRALVRAHESGVALISRPIFGDEHGHPTIFRRPLFGELATLSEETEGLKSVLRRHADAIANVPLDDPIVLLNLNRPDEYEAAAARYAPK
jgi:molybdenum cofactor cytidylyltransferase